MSQSLAALVELVGSPGVGGRCIENERSVVRRRRSSCLTMVRSNACDSGADAEGWEREVGVSGKLLLSGSSWGKSLSVTPVTSHLQFLVCCEGAGKRSQLFNGWRRGGWERVDFAVGLATVRSERATSGPNRDVRGGWAAGARGVQSETRRSPLSPLTSASSSS